MTNLELSQTDREIASYQATLDLPIRPGLRSSQWCCCRVAAWLDERSSTGYQSLGYLETNWQQEAHLTRQIHSNTCPIECACHPRNTYFWSRVWETRHQQSRFPPVLLSDLLHLWVPVPRRLAWAFAHRSPRALSCRKGDSFYWRKKTIGCLIAQKWATFAQSSVFCCPGQRALKEETGNEVSSAHVSMFLTLMIRGLIRVVKVLLRILDGKNRSKMMEYEYEIDPR